MKKNIIAGIVALVFIAVAASATPVSAFTVDELQAQIKVLLAKVAELQVQLRTATTVQTPPVDPTITPPLNKHRICNILARNLTPGTRGDDVRGLQEFLSTEGYLSANATGYFGPMTAQAVAKWQSSEGVNAVGSFGPMSRERIKIWCGNPRPQVCTQEYNPVCGSKPIVCITTPCNPIPQTYGNRCEMNADGAAFLYEGQCRNDSVNKPPVVSSFSGPTSLAVNASGTWSINASDPENGQLNYQISWGDERVYAPMMMDSSAAARAFVQTTTFTHAYSFAGTYTVTVVVRDSAGQEAKTSTTVKIGDDGVICTTEYAPVCGQPAEPACRRSIPACMMATPGPQTYSNRCVMNGAGATFLYSGECR